MAVTFVYLDHAATTALRPEARDDGAAQSTNWANQKIDFFADLGATRITSLALALPRPAGKQFSDALARHDKLFGPLYVNMVRASEISGSLRSQ